MEIWSCGLRHRVPRWILTSISEEPGASIFKAEEQKAAGSPERLVNLYGNSSGLISQKTLILTSNTIFQSLGLETGGEMKWFELNASKKTIALNISYFLNTTFIRYSRPQTFEIWHVCDKFLATLIVRFLQHSDVPISLSLINFTLGSSCLFVPSVF